MLRLAPQLTSDNVPSLGCEPNRNNRNPNQSDSANERGNSDQYSDEDCAEKQAPKRLCTNDSQECENHEVHDKNK